MPAASPASPFSALLRRSRFASFDPTIGQVYTSHGGHIYRGNWGFKRPLPIRRQDAHVTVNAVDSKEEQTEWRQADREGRFMKMWDEVGITPSLDTNGTWHTKLGTKSHFTWGAGTEFVDASEANVEAVATSQAESDIHGSISSAVPNIYAMSDKEFRRHLKTLRASRPAFVSYLREVVSKKAQKQGQPLEFTSAWDSSLGPSQDHTMFLRSQAYRTYNSTESRTIEQQPHPSAGLAYGKASALQHHLLHKSKPGHVTIKMPTAVSFAGLHADAEASSGVITSGVNFTELANTGHRNREEGVGKFIFKTVTFAHAPQTVGKVPQRLTAAGIDAKVVPEGASSMQRTNTHPPGSPQYVSHNLQKINPNTILSPRPFKANVPVKEMSEKDTIASSAVLSTLTGMLPGSHSTSNPPRSR